MNKSHSTLRPAAQFSVNNLEIEYMEWYRRLFSDFIDFETVGTKVLLKVGIAKWK
jgi:hypothetical protein